ncbi:MAG TPA: MltA domain-containing protein, partial [Caulobacteraceae bacterium]|nr:MltA domain-containing protein [Caulobacteraceae bacterium]
MIRRGRLLAAGALLVLAACATAPPELSPPAGRTLAPTVPTLPTPRVSWSHLPGWAAEDHLGALEAVRAACRVRPTRYLDACRDLAAEPPASNSEAQRFFERWFVLEAEPDDGLLTAYYTPVYDARRTPEPPFTAPLRPAGDPTLAAEDRAAIAAAPADDALAWLKPEELFFLQVQGSGVLQMDDGTRFKAAYAGSNGK